MFCGRRGPGFDELYEELGTLGSGSFGELIKVKHKIDGKFYAIKVVTNIEPLRSVTKEAEIHASLKHANIVGYNECFFSDMLPENERATARDHEVRSDNMSVQYHVQDRESDATSLQDEKMEVDASRRQLSLHGMSRQITDPVPRSLFYIRMELCDSDLQTFMKNRLRLKNKEVWHVMHSLVSALEYLGCMNIVHGDIKLANILLKKSDDSDDAKPMELLRCTVKLSNFGLATSAKFEQGQIEDRSIKSDIFYLGWVLLRMLVHPCDDAKWRYLRKDVLRGKLPDNLEQCERRLLLTKDSGMLHHDENQRSDLAAVKEHMEKWHTSRPLLTMRVTT